MKTVLTERLHAFDASIFGVMTAMSVEHDAINLAQGFPDFDGPDLIKRAAKKAIDSGWNQYGPPAGLPVLRRAIANKTARNYHYDIDPDRHVIVTCGATQALYTAIAALTNRGDEVIAFEPFYESYPQIVAMAGAEFKTVTLDFPDYKLDVDALERAITVKTKLIVLNTPHNPTGKVLSRYELTAIADLAKRHQLIVVADEVYEHLTFDAHVHIPIATLPDMFERTVTISSTAKTYSFTGWKIGYLISSERLTAAILRAHQNIVFCVATPLQEAMAVVLDDVDQEVYFQEFRAQYDERRETLHRILDAVGFRVAKPQGTYFLLADFTPFGFDDDVEFAQFLTKEVGVSVIPPSCFYLNRQCGRHLVRFAFCKSQTLLQDAGTRLQKLKNRKKVT